MEKTKTTDFLDTEALPEKLFEEEEEVQQEVSDAEKISAFKELKYDESGPVIILTSLFFIWGFLTVMNSLLAPKLESVFDLNRGHEILLSQVFFAGYFLGGLIYFVLSLFKFDLINAIGYKKTIVIGLLTSALGCGLFYPAAENVHFETFVFALFILATGFAILQIVANPYVTRLGSSDTASSRLNMVQAFNSLGTTLAPYVGSLLLLDLHTGDPNSAGAVKIPYMILAGVLAGLALLISFAFLPEIRYRVAKVPSRIRDQRHTWLATLAVFLYVGAEVSIGTNLADFLALPEIAGVAEDDAGFYIALYWGGAMIGRFMGAIYQSKMTENSKVWSGVLMMLAAFIVGRLVSESWQLGGGFLLVALINFIVFHFSPRSSHRLLGNFAVAAIVLLLFGVFFTGKLAMWSIIAIGIFNSIMFNNIFALGVNKLKKLTSQGSSLMVMAISGGGVIVIGQDYLKNLLNIQYSFLFPVLCYAFIAVYAYYWAQPKIKEKVS